MARYRPPFEITPSIVASVGAAERLLGRFDGLLRPAPAPKLRRSLAIRTVQATLAIEGALLDVEQVTAMLDGKRVLGAQLDLIAARNAIAAYRRASTWKGEREADFLAAHAVLMKGLVADAGSYRRSNVGVLAGSRVAHVAPQAKRVQALMTDLLTFVRDRETHPLVKSAVVHYEIEFIHPFSDGNGRMGRLWQHVLLLKLDSAFAHVPIESVVRERQAQYYAALAAADHAGTATPFVEFSLETVRQGLETFLRELRPARLTVHERLVRAQEALGRRSFSRNDYVAALSPLSTATASRDLAFAVETGVATRQGDKATARYRFRH
jgi:Fic family protein